MNGDTKFFCYLVVLSRVSDNRKAKTAEANLYSESGNTISITMLPNTAIRILSHASERRKGHSSTLGRCGFMYLIQLLMRCMYISSHNNLEHAATV